MTNTLATLNLLIPGPNDFVEVAVLERGGFVESRHRGIAVLVGPDGKLVDHLGSSKRLIYPRSAVKPIQAVAMRRAGLKVTGAQLAICCASHQGTAQHIALVQSLLESVGLEESSLQCPTAWPGNPVARSNAAGDSKLAFNCSGKHAGFLAASVAAGWDIKTYLDLSHPMQQLALEVLEEFAGEKVLHSTVDGCGAPLHMLTVEGLARAFGKLALEEREITDAMLKDPWAVGDANTCDAILMSEGLVSKLGAEGVLAVATTDGHAVAIKIADGSLRAAPLVAVALLTKHGLLDLAAAQRLNQQLAVPALGGSQVLGGIRAL